MSVSVKAGLVIGLSGTLACQGPAALEDGSTATGGGSSRLARAASAGKQSHRRQDEGQRDEPARGHAASLPCSEGCRRGLTTPVCQSRTLRRVGTG